MRSLKLVRKVFVYLTEGSLGDRRINESRNFLEKMEIDHFSMINIGKILHISDGLLLDFIEIASIEICRQLRLSELSQGSVRLICPTADGGHQDHDCAGAIAGLIHRDFAQIRDVFCFYSYNGLRTTGSFFMLGYQGKENVEWVRKTSLAWELKKIFMTILIFKSQIKTWVLVMPVYVLSLICRRRFDLVRQKGRPDWVLNQTLPLYLRHKRTSKAFSERLKAKFEQIFANKDGPVREKLH